MRRSRRPTRRANLVRKPLLYWLAETATEPVLVHVRAGCKLTCLRRKDTHAPLPFVAARWSVTHPVLCTTGFVS